MTDVRVRRAKTADLSASEVEVIRAILWAAFDDPDGNGWAVQESPTIRRELLAADAPAPVPA